MPNRNKYNHLNAYKIDFKPLFRMPDSLVADKYRRDAFPGVDEDMKLQWIFEQGTSSNRMHGIYFLMHNLSQGTR